MKTTTRNDKLLRIRKRASYRFFQQLYEFLKDSPSVADIMRKFNDILDAKRSYGSGRNARYAEESLELVLRDNGEYLSSVSKVLLTALQLTSYTTIVGGSPLDRKPPEQEDIVILALHRLLSSHLHQVH